MTKVFVEQPLALPGSAKYTLGISNEIGPVGGGDHVGQQLKVNS